MRSLIVADEFPWPADNGYRMRLDHVVRGLAAAGPLDLLVLLDRPDRPAVPTDAPVERVRVLYLPPSRRSVGGYLGWFASGAPRTVATRPWRTVRHAIPALIDEWAPDVVWWSHADVFGQTGKAATRPAIVDLDNLEDRKLRDRRRARHHDLRSAGHRRTIDVLGRDALDRVDEHRWRRRQRAILHRAQVTVVCSELDRARLDAHDVVIVPNAYDPPDGDLAATRAPDPATFTLIGLFTYEPNLDAARHLVRAVLPPLLDALPEAQVRLVGHHDGALTDLAGPHVTVTGPVASVVAELRRATAVVVPMRFGGGTRLKVLEAFASGVPVVSTTLGAEGLGAADARELLLADDPAGLATACVDVVRRPTETAARVVRAQRLWAERFSGAHAQAQIADVAHAALRASTPPTRDAEAMVVVERCRRAARHLPPPVQERLARIAGSPALRRRIRPVRWGSLRRTAPVSRRYGFDRGTPIDRIYLDRFFRTHASDIRGRVLEVDAPQFTQRHGEPGAVTDVDVVDIDGRNDRATILADLGDPGVLPTASFDCILLPQTMQYVADPSVAVANLWGALAPGGVLLLTVPAVAKIDHHARDVDAWRWLPHGLAAQLAGGCPGAEIEVTGFGNALSGAAFFVGACAEDVGRTRVEHVDPDFPVLVAARVRKPGNS